MIELKPRLVSFYITTRVIAPNDLSEDELVNIAKKQIIDNRFGDIDENVESIEEDTEERITESKYLSSPSSRSQSGISFSPIRLEIMPSL